VLREAVSASEAYDLVPVEKGWGTGWVVWHARWAGISSYQDIPIPHGGDERMKRQCGPPIRLTPELPQVDGAPKSLRLTRSLADGPLDAVIQELKHCYNGLLVITEPEIPRRTGSGLFPLAGLNNAMPFLATSA
jgi:hypothetical protein